MKNSQFDYLVVGAGLAGATFAWAAKSQNKSVLVIDKRDHIAGNCYTKKIADIDVHMYGPHLFHTNSRRIWNFVNRFATFNDYHHIVTAKTLVGVLSLPINLFTLSSLYGVQTPDSAKRLIKAAQIKDADDANIEGWCLRNIGKDLYDLLIREYTMKQWGVHPNTLPASIIKRLPVRYTYDSRYFTDTYQGIPINGYTDMVAAMLDGIDVHLGVDFIEDILSLKRQARRIVYTGSIDALYGYNQGQLPYRSIRLETEVLNTPDFQGVGQMNYTRPGEAYTRIIEHRHFNEPRYCDKTV